MSQVNDTRLDPATLAVLQNGLRQVVEEMDVTIEKLAFNPTMSEARDRASGIYDANTGEVVSQGETGMPIFVGVMQFAVQAAIEEFPDLSQGDIVILNDPYLGGTHLMDMKLVMPFYYDGVLVAMLGNTGHWTDIGGSVPGGFGVHATEIFQEGVRIPPLRLYRRGEINDDLIGLMLANMRVPEERMGDLKAQVAALNTGARRFTELINKHGLDTIQVAIGELHDRSEMQMRSYLTKIPNGDYYAEEYMDSDGITQDPIRIALRVTSVDDTLAFDFTGSSEPVQGPLNAAAPATIAAIYLALKHLFPEIPINGGCFVPVQVEIPDNVFLNAKYPKAVSGSSAEVSLRVVDAVFSALSSAIPERVPAHCFGTVANLTISGVDPANSKPYVMFRFSGGGYGGHPSCDGLTNGSAPISASRTSQIEVLEQLYPVQFTHYAIRPGSAGAGQYRGGYGASFAIQLLRGEAVSSVLADRGRFAPAGLAGGAPGDMTVVTYELNHETHVPQHTTKDDQILMRAGDTARIETPGGGGWGNPEDRAAHQILADIAKELITFEEAEVIYKTSLTSTRELGHADTGGEVTE